MTVRGVSRHFAATSAIRLRRSAFLAQLLGTQYDATVVVHAEGVLVGDAITGTALVHQYGTIEGTLFDCTTVYDVTGMRVD